MLGRYGKGGNSQKTWKAGKPFRLWIISCLILHFCDPQCCYEEKKAITVSCWITNSRDPFSPSHEFDRIWLVWPWTRHFEIGVIEEIASKCHRVSEVYYQMWGSTRNEQSLPAAVAAGNRHTYNDDVMNYYEIELKWYFFLQHRLRSRATWCTFCIYWVHV